MCQALRELGKSGGLRLPKKLLGSKEHPDWYKRDLNAAEIITVQDYKCTKNQCEWKCTYTVLKLRVK